MISRWRLSHCAVCLIPVVVAGVGTVAFGRVSERADRHNAVDEVRLFLESWNHAISQHDIKAVRASYSVDASFEWFEDGARRYGSREEIIAALQAFPDGAMVRTELSDIRVRVLSDDLAYISASFETRLEFGGAPIEFGGVFSSIVRRTDDRWVFANGHSSTRRPGAP